MLSTSNVSAEQAGTYYTQDDYYSRDAHCGDQAQTVNDGEIAPKAALLAAKLQELGIDPDLLA